MLNQDKEVTPVCPYLVVEDVDAATDYYFRAYGARLTERYEDTTGKVWYAVMRVFGMPLQLMEPDANMGHVARDLDVTPEDNYLVNVNVPDVESSVVRAAEAGAQVLLEPVDAEWGGKTAEVRDPFGHRWVHGPALFKKDRKQTPLSLQLVVDDVGASLAFWRDVFGVTEVRRQIRLPKESAPLAVVRHGRAAVQLTEATRGRGVAPFSARKVPTGDSSMVTISVDDVDSVFDRAIRSGATPILAPQDAYWGDRYAEFRDVAGLRVSACGEQSIANAVVDPVDLQSKLDYFLALNGDPTSPAKAVGAMNVGAVER
jgi:PhnB protein